jgi:acetyl/propionyl-CoA carboxylase alpha subunit
MAYEFRVGGRISEVVPLYRRDGFDLSIDGRPVRAALRLRASDTGEAELEIEGRVHRVLVARRGDVVWVQLDGRAHAVELVDSLRRAASEAAQAVGGDALVAPMPGVVVGVSVAKGDAVGEGDLLVTIESMKLHTAIRAPHAARVAEIAFGRGASFEKGAVLVRLERAAGEATAR